MTEFLNENPQILDESQLPKRVYDNSDELLIESSDKMMSIDRKKLLLKMDHSLNSQVLQNVELLDKLLTLHSVPSLESDTGDDDMSSIEEDELEIVDAVDAQEIFDLIAHISDPEHPLTLGKLAIVNLEDIEVTDSGNVNEIAHVLVRITPTITHCSLATLIGLGIRVRLERALSPRFRITILLKKGTHQSENQVNKQLNDKERVAAACENDQLLGVVSNMLKTCI